MGSNPTVSASVESRLSLIQSAETGLVSFGCCSIVATALAGDLAFLEAPALLSRRHLPPDDVADHIAHWLPRDSAVPWQQNGNTSEVPNFRTSARSLASPPGVTVRLSLTSESARCDQLDVPIKLAGRCFCLCVGAFDGIDAADVDSVRQAEEWRIV